MPGALGAAAGPGSCPSHPLWQPSPHVLIEGSSGAQGWSRASRGPLSAELARRAVAVSQGKQAAGHPLLWKPSSSSSSGKFHFKPNQMRAQRAASHLTVCTPERGNRGGPDGRPSLHEASCPDEARAHKRGPAPGRVWGTQALLQPCVPAVYTQGSLCYPLVRPSPHHQGLGRPQAGAATGCPAGTRRPGASAHLPGCSGYLCLQ